MKTFPICNFKNLLKLLNIIKNVSKKHTQKIPANELHKREAQANIKKRKRERTYKTVSPLFHDFQQLDPTSCGNQSVG